MAGKNDGKIRCSFCGKTQDQVNRLISGPNGAFIIFLPPISIVLL